MPLLKNENQLKYLYTFETITLFFCFINTNISIHVSYWLDCILLIFIFYNQILTIIWIVNIVVYNSWSFYTLLFVSSFNIMCIMHACFFYFFNKLFFSRENIFFGIFFCIWTKAIEERKLYFFLKNSVCINCLSVFSSIFFKWRSCFFCYF